MIKILSPAEENMPAGEKNKTDERFALIESEERYRRLFESAKDGILLLDFETGKIEGVNPFMTRLLGYPKEFFVGKCLWEVGSFKDIALSKDDFLRLKARGYIRYEDLPLEKKNGQRAAVEFVSNIYRSGGKKVIQCNIRDISARKKAETALRESEARSRAFFEQASDLVLVLEIPPAGEPIIWDVNLVAQKALDYSRGEIRGKPVSMIYESSDAARSARRKIGGMRPGEKMIFELNHKRRDGSVFTVETSVREIAIGGARMAVLIERDITERKKLETATRETWEIDQMLDALRRHSLTSLPLRKKLANQLVALFSIPWLSVEPKGAVFLVSGKNLILEVQQGLAPDLLISCAKVPFGKCPCGRAAESGKAVASTGVGPEHEIAYEGMCAHGHYCAPIAAAGMVLGVLTLYLKENTVLTVKQKDFIHGVTSIIASDILRARVEEQLAQSQKMEAVGQLAGGIAHDLNNILTAVLGYSSLLAAAIPAGDPRRADLDEIVKAGERAAALTRQLLAFSRKQVVQFKDLNLDLIVPETLKMLRRMVPENIEFRTFFKSSPEKVLANQGQLEQVILNLAVNARDAMPKGGTLTFETAPAELDESSVLIHPGILPGRYIMLAVSDTGSGMSPEIVRHIFEPFFTTKEKSKGTGLGLSTVYGIVKQSGGNITVYSEPGKGTTIKVYLPVTAEKIGKEPAEKPSFSSSRGTETILLVEDEEPVRKLISRLLSQNGYTVLAAAAPGEAIELCKLRRDIRLLLTDIVMPQMNGYELAKTVIPLAPLMKVIFMSGYTDNALSRQNIMNPGLVFLEKPLKVDALLGKIREVLEGGPQ
ncbi:MAG: hypothetical protein COT17_06135 [Elusimicrobia bacterium CG08_land_8_20_14_0_20_51_18]|nr:MAG: hypothetical protein COT17_06135 [Elusimicrobia bacterium CG08_land_8_20_14_0_20_51_18]